MEEKALKENILSYQGISFSTRIWAWKLSKNYECLWISYAMKRAMTLGKFSEAASLSVLGPKKRQTNKISLPK